MLLGHRIGGRVDRFATMKRDSNEGYIDRRCDADARSNLDFTFDPRLDVGKTRHVS